MGTDFGLSVQDTYFPNQRTRLRTQFQRWTPPLLPTGAWKAAALRQWPPAKHMEGMPTSLAPGTEGAARAWHRAFSYFSLFLSPFQIN